MINPENGNFQITEKIIVGKTKTYDDIVKLAPTSRTWDIENGYRWIYFDEIEIDQMFFDIEVCFHNNQLFCIDFGFANKEESDSGWDNWNEEDELKRKEVYEEWLTKIIGEKRSFDWVTIGAYFDQRGGTTSMNIRYK